MSCQINNTPLTNTPRGRGFTLLEVVIATLVMGLMLVAAMNTLGSAIRGQRLTGQQSHAALLANDLLAEILAHPYADPEGGTGLGTDAGEGSSTRVDFDDVDDFDGWSGSPPEDVGGTALASGFGLTRNVSVDYVNKNNFTQVIGADQGVKRIEVSVVAGGNVLAKITTVVTDDS